jgi:phage terminase large subunit-like protein
MGIEDKGTWRLLRAAGREIGADERGWARFVGGMPGPEQRGLYHDFFGWQAHGGQVAPPMSGPGCEWTIWLMMAGRGFGKTRAGAEWVLARAREVPGARIALVGATADEVARVMIEGPSGLLALAMDDEEMLWVPTQGVVTFASGAQAFVYSAAAWEGLRGPEHDFAWADELAKWERADEAFDNLMMGMRRGPRPRVVVTTTPRAVAVLRRIRGMEGVVETGGATRDNPHLPDAFKSWVTETYGGTRLGRQELDGLLIEEPEGALFPRALLEGARVEGARTGPHPGPLPQAGEGGSGARVQGPPPAPPGSPGGEESGFWRRVVVGVDPPASATGDACGIVVCGPSRWRRGWRRGRSSWRGGSRTWRTSWRGCSWAAAMRDRGAPRTGPMRACGR